MNTVSVIIPTYNSENTIEKCVLSVMNQSSEYLSEIIVIDDGSTDTTEEKIRNLSNIDPRIYYHKKVNGGVSSARNLGIELVHGKYVMFIDSDDEIKSDIIENMVKHSNNNDLVVSGIELHQESGCTEISKEGTFSPSEVIENYGNSIPGLLVNGPCAKLFRKELLESKEIKFEEGLSLGEDTLFVFQYLKYCSQVIFIKNIGYVYYQMGNTSLMTKFRKDGYQNAKYVYLLLFDIAKSICKGNIPVSLKAVYKNVLMVYIRKTIYNKDKVDKLFIKNIIRDYFMDKVVRDYILTEIGTVGGLQKCLDYCVLKNKYLMFEYILKFHVKIRGI